MNWSRFSTASMIFALQYLVSNQEARTLMEENELLRPWLPRLKDSLEKLLQSRKITPPLTPKREKEIRRQIREILDPIHDEDNQLLHALLEMARRFHPDESERKRYSQLQQDLYPYGLRIICMKWLAEAAEGLRLKEQLQNPDLAQSLQQLSFQAEPFSINGLELAQRIVATAQQMEPLLLELYGLEDEKTSSAEGEARNNFARIVSRFVRIVELEFEEQPDNMEMILKALHEEGEKLPTLPQKPDDPNET